MLQISHIKLTSPFILAPLAGYSDLPFRILCREFGAGLCVSEMISCHGLMYGQEKTLNMLATVPEERPVSIQLFGADPEVMGKAAAILRKHTLDLVDINMGCPVKKVTKKGAGAALMQTPSLASQIIKTVIQESDSPVTVKFRTGLNSSNITAVSFAKMVEDSGASAITIHGRTWAQGFGGKADWEVIKQVKENVSIPVIGNGDILSYQDGLSMMAETECDGVMIGRGAMGNPWVFQKNGRPQHLDVIAATTLRHMELMEQYLPVNRLLASIKSHMGQYFKGMPGSAKIRKKIFDTTSFHELKRILSGLKEAGN